MSIEFDCPSCKCKQRAADYLVGRTLRCQKCGKAFTVPSNPYSESVPRTPAPTEPEPDKDKLYSEPTDSESIFGD
jgi:hypothetical protein